MAMASSQTPNNSSSRLAGSNPNNSALNIDASPMSRTRPSSNSITHMVDGNTQGQGLYITAPNSTHHHRAPSNDKSPLMSTSSSDSVGMNTSWPHQRRPSAASSSSTTPSTAASSWSSQSMVPPPASNGSGSPSSPPYNVMVSSTSSPHDGIGGVNVNDTPPLHISPPTAGNSPIAVLGATILPIMEEEKQSANVAVTTVTTGTGTGSNTPLMNQSTNNYGSSSATGSAVATPSGSGHGTPVAEGSLPFVLSATSSPAAGAATTSNNNNKDNINAASTTNNNASSNKPASGATNNNNASSNTNTSSTSSSGSSSSRRRHSQGPDPSMRARVTGGHSFGAWRANNASIASGTMAELRGDKKATGARSGRMPSLDKLLHRATYYLPEVYHRVNPTFTYHRSANPRRVLTEPSERVGNNGCDNTHSNLVMCVNDVLHSETGPFRSFRVLELLGEGTFGQVVKCEDCETKVQVAVKVIKNKPAYHNQALMEIRILKTLNDQYDPNDQHHLLRMTDYFTYKHHLCLVFELLSVNLYELIKQNHFRGLSCHLIRTLLEQLCDTMQLLRAARVIHCDLKPENVLLVKLTSAQIKLIDFGSACMEYQTVYSYIQSRFYRSPEALLGLPYDSAIDMWSLGCIAAELFLGLPIFPGVSQYNQMYRIISMIGPPPVAMLQKGKHTAKFFNYNKDTGTYTLKSNEQWAKENNVEAVPSKVYFKGNNLRELVDLYPMRKTSSEESRLKELADRECFLHFITGLLQWDPMIRWSPAQAAQHPFVLKQMIGAFDERKFERIRAEERHGAVASSNNGGGTYPLATTLAASSSTSVASSGAVTASSSSTSSSNTNPRSSPNRGVPTTTIAAPSLASQLAPPPYHAAGSGPIPPTVAASSGTTTGLMASPTHNTGQPSAPPSYTTQPATQGGAPVAGVVVSAVPTLGSALKYGNNNTNNSGGHGTRQTRAGSSGGPAPWNATTTTTSSGVTLGLGLHTGATTGGTASQPFLQPYGGGGAARDFGTTATMTTSPHHHASSSYGTSGSGVAASFIPNAAGNNNNPSHRPTGSFGGHGGQRRNSRGTGNNGATVGVTTYPMNPDGTVTMGTDGGHAITSTVPGAPVFRDRRGGAANIGGSGNRGGRGGGGGNRRGGRGLRPPGGPHVAFGHHGHHLTNPAASGIHPSSSPLYLHGGGGHHPSSSSSASSAAASHSESADTVSEQLVPPNAAATRVTRQTRAQSLDTHNMSQRPVFHSSHGVHGHSGHGSSHRHHHQPHHTSAYQQHQQQQQAARAAARQQAWHHHHANPNSSGTSATVATLATNVASSTAYASSSSATAMLSTLPPSSTASGGNSALLVTTAGPGPASSSGSSSGSSSMVSSPSSLHHTSPSSSSQQQQHHHQRRGSANNSNPNPAASSGSLHHRVGSGNSPGGGGGTGHHSRPGSSGGTNIGGITAMLNAFPPSTPTHSNGGNGNGNGGAVNVVSVPLSAVQAAIAANTANAGAFGALPLPLPSSMMIPHGAQQQQPRSPYHQQAQPSQQQY